MITPIIRIELEDGRLRARRAGPAPPYDPFVRVIEAIRDPGVVVAAFDRWLTTHEAPGFIAGENVASLYFESYGVIAEISLSKEDFEERVGYDAFEPILRSWQRAWAERDHPPA